jgi:hypothetical protein
MKTYSVTFIVQVETDGNFEDAAGTAIEIIELGAENYHFKTEMAER